MSRIRTIRKHIVEPAKEPVRFSVKEMLGLSALAFLAGAVFCFLVLELVTVLA